MRCGSSRDNSANVSRSRKSLALALAWTGLLADTARGAGLDRDLAEYQEIVGQYRSGDMAGAVRRIAEWDGARLVQTARRFAAAEEPSRPLGRGEALGISAAGLLHQEVLARHPRGPGFEGHQQPVAPPHPFDELTLPQALPRIFASLRFWLIASSLMGLTILWDFLLVVPMLFWLARRQPAAAAPAEARDLANAADSSET